MCTGLEVLSNHTDLLKPSNLISLLQHGIVAPLEHFHGILTQQTAMCFNDRSTRIRVAAAALAEYLITELREKDSVLDDEIRQVVEFRKGMRDERRKIVRGQALVNASTLLEEVEVNGVPKSSQGRKNGPSFVIASDGVVTIHESLRLNIAAIAAAIGCLSLRGQDGSDTFANEIGGARVAALDNECLWSEDDDSYLVCFWVRVMPTEVADYCGCLQCKELY
jgi:hypothetical protein